MVSWGSERARGKTPAVHRLITGARPGPAGYSRYAASAALRGPSQRAPLRERTMQGVQIRILELPAHGDPGGDASDPNPERLQEF